MNSAENLIEKTKLENRAILELYDGSRTIIGDRMLVSLTVRVHIPVNILYQDDMSDGLPPAEEIRTALGDPITWEHTRQRRFIDAREKTEVFESLRADFEENMRPYLNHPQFPAGCFRRQMEEYRKQSTWYK